MKWAAAITKANFVPADISNPLNVIIGIHNVPTNPKKSAVKHSKGVGTLNLLPHCGSGLPG